MRIKRLPLVFLVFGLILKTLLLLFWKHSRLPIFADLLVYYDPGGRYFAETVTRLLFDYGGITFAPGSATFYEVSLVIGFGIECLLAGFLLRWLLGRFHDQRPDEGMARG